MSFKEEFLRDLKTPYKKIDHQYPEVYSGMSRQFDSKHLIFVHTLLIYPQYFTKETFFCLLTVDCRVIHREILSFKICRANLHISSRMHPISE
jgi:hypothetical protein